MKDDQAATLSSVILSSWLSSSGDLDAVLELHAVEYVGDELVAVEPAPALLR